MATARNSFLVLALCLLRRSCAARISGGGVDKAPRSGGCSAQSNCGDCLMAKPTWTTTATYCRWCPQEFWTGDASAFKENATGVCRKNNKAQYSCAGGSEWIYVGNSPMDRGSDRGFIAADAEEAAQWCPSTDQQTPIWRVRTLNSVQAKDLQDPVMFDATLHLLNLDVKRLHRLRLTNPNLYNALFDPHYSSKAALYAWKISAWGVTFIPAVGTFIAMGLGLATSAIEGGVDFESKIVSAQRTSQANMVSKGKKAVLEYFSDVTYGMLEKQSKNTGTMTKALRDAKQEATNDGNLVQGTGTTVGKVDKAFGHIGYRLGKALVHTGLFVGGFFTFGLTWIIGTALGAAEMMTEWGVAYAAAKSLDQKMFLLIALAYKLDESIWGSNGTACNITDWDAGIDPCPDIDRLGSEGEKVPRVCSRTSAWGLHNETNPKGDLSAEGRCIPRIRHGLQAGSPCVTHEGCQSGYCHFEPRLLHLFSDHDRKSCFGGVANCTEEQEQLRALQLAGAGVGGEELLNFTKNYKGSFHGPLYATMGTCAVPCPATKIGRGDCDQISFDAKGEKELKAATGVAGYEFGIRRPGSYVVGQGKKSFRKVGIGHCGKMVDGRTDTPARKLKTAKKIDLTKGNAVDPENVEAEIVEDESVEDGVIACAKQCWSSWMVCRAVTLDEKVCTLHFDMADTVVEVNLAGETQCYSAEQDWPLDIYQPWNFEWQTYRLNLRRVVDKMMNYDEDNSTLKAVREAYKNWCNTTVKGVNVIKCQEVDGPATWNAMMAANVLLEFAPLSATQMMALSEKIFPGSTELPARPDEQIKMRDMLNRPFGFGAAWRYYFGPITVKLITEDPDPSTVVVENQRSMSKAWVQGIERDAVELGVRTPQGLWDFATVVENRKKDAAAEATKKFTVNEKHTVAGSTATDKVEGMDNVAKDTTKGKLVDIDRVVENTATDEVEGQGIAAKDTTKDKLVDTDRAAETTKSEQLVSS